MDEHEFVKALEDYNNRSQRSLNRFCIGMAVLWLIAILVCMWVIGRLP